MLERFRSEHGLAEPAEHFDYDYRSVSLSARFGSDDPALFHGQVEEGYEWSWWLRTPPLSRWREVLEAVRARFPACRFFLRSCGDVGALLPDIVELGFHILHPLQPECMGVAEVRAEARRRQLQASRPGPSGPPAC